MPTRPSFSRTDAAVISPTCVSALLPGGQHADFLLTQGGTTPVELDGPTAPARPPQW
jgi:hypothetical protein